MSDVEELQAMLDRSWGLARQANDQPGFRTVLEESVYSVSELPAKVREDMLRARQDPGLHDWIEDQAALEAQKRLK
jgi:hypothetical protein